MLAKKDFDKAE